MWKLCLCYFLENLLFFSFPISEPKLQTPNHFLLSVMLNAPLPLWTPTVHVRGKNYRYSILICHFFAVLIHQFSNCCKPEILTSNNVSHLTYNYYKMILHSLTFRLQRHCSQFFDLLCRLLDYLTGEGFSIKFQVYIHLI